VLAEVNAGGTPSEAMLSVGIVAMALAASGTFVQLLAVAIGLVLILDSVAIAALFRLRARQRDAPFRVPLYRSYRRRSFWCTWRCSWERRSHSRGWSRSRWACWRRRGD